MLPPAKGPEEARGVTEDAVPAGFVAEAGVVGVACAVDGLVVGVALGEADGLPWSAEEPADGLVPRPAAAALAVPLAEVLEAGLDRPVHDERAPVE